MDNEVPDPIAMDLLTTRWVEALDAELAAHGVRNLRPLSGGTFAVVLQADDSRAVRLSFGRAIPRPEIPEMLQSLASGEVGYISWEILPLADTCDITEADVAAMDAALKERGFKFSDAGTDNLGRLDGRLVVLDPGAVRQCLTPDPAAPSFGR